MKRKASTLDDTVNNGDWALFDCSSSTSTASPESIKAVADRDQIHAHWNVGTIPYMSSRTRKRYRDGRPDQETIHQNTLAKLFNAQRQIHTEGHRGDWQTNALPTASTGVHAPSNILTWPASNPSLEQPERNQRSINSFFGGSSAPVASRRLQPATFQFSSTHNDKPTTLQCEDCSTALQSSGMDTSMSDTDAMTMDVGLQHDEWACASCSRRVCDLCAVRGDQRICLECAVPGGG